MAVSSLLETRLRLLFAVALVLGFAQGAKAEALDRAGADANAAHAPRVHRHASLADALPGAQLVGAELVQLLEPQVPGLVPQLQKRFQPRR